MERMGENRVIGEKRLSDGLKHGVAETTNTYSQFFPDAFPRVVLLRMST